MSFTTEIELTLKLYLVFYDTFIYVDYAYLCWLCKSLFNFIISVNIIFFYRDRLIMEKRISIKSKILSQFSRLIKIVWSLSFVTSELFFSWLLNFRHFSFSFSDLSNLLPFFSIFICIYHQIYIIFLN